MEKISLNGYGMKNSIAILKEAIQDGLDQHFKIQCENCTLSILTSNQFGHNKGTIEVALRNIDDSAWIPLEINGYIEERPIIPTFPLVAFPALVTQFKALDKTDFSEVWNAWDVISCYS